MDNILTFETRYKILIVDDYVRNVQLLQDTLELEGIDTIAAYDGQEAIDILEKESVDLILLDVFMPVLDGFKACQIIKENPATSEIPVIFITARSESQDIVKGFNIGAVDYITKPFNTKELISRINTHLELKRSHDIITRQNKILDEKNKNLDKKNQELAELNATKDKFFSIIARDLKEPFSILIGSSNLLMNKIDVMDTSKIKRFNEAINRSSQSGYNLLENLLEWSKAQTGTLEFNPKQITIATLQSIVRQQIALGEYYARNKKITITNDLKFDSTDKETPIVLADPELVKAIFRNLLSNAFKFTGAGGSVVISNEYIIDTETDNTKYVQIKVTDTGVGIPKQYQDNLFRIDVRKAIIGTSDERGTGLGLILCSEYVKLNGGRIWVESTEDEGSSFYFTLRAI